MLLFLLILTLKKLVLCFTIVSITIQTSLAEVFIFVIILSYMDLNVSSMSESLAITLVLEWKTLRSFLFLYSKTNIV